MFKVKPQTNYLYLIYSYLKENFYLISLPKTRFCWSVCLGLGAGFFCFAFLAERGGTHTFYPSIRDVKTEEYTPRPAWEIQWDPDSKIT